MRVCGCGGERISERQDGETARHRRVHDSRDTRAHNCDSDATAAATATATATATTTSGEGFTRSQAIRRNASAPLAAHRRRRETRLQSGKKTLSGACKRIRRKLVHSRRRVTRKVAPRLFTTQFFFARLRDEACITSMTITATQRCGAIRRRRLVTLNFIISSS